jgi:hypothetical protein
VNLARWTSRSSSSSPKRSRRRENVSDAADKAVTAPSWTQSPPEGGFDARTGWAGMMKPAGRGLKLIAMRQLSARSYVGSIRLKSPGVSADRLSRGRSRTAAITEFRSNATTAISNEMTLAAYSRK